MDSLFNKLLAFRPATLLKGEPNTGVFCEYCKVCKDTLKTFFNFKNKQQKCMKYSECSESRFILYSTQTFLENVSSKESVKPCFFVTFNVMISHIFPEKFIEVLQGVQEIQIISLAMLTIPKFSSTFWILCYFLIKKKLMASAYNR